MSDDKSLFAIVPHEQVGQLMAQFLGNDTRQAGGGKTGRQHSQARAGRSNRGGGRRQEHQPRNNRQGQRQQGPKNRAKNQPLSQDLLPQYNGWQFVGDSMMVRLGTFSSRGNSRPTFNKQLHANQLGACVGGQTCGQLLRLLRSKDCPKIGPKVILMIGTNNILKRVPDDETETAFKHVVEELKHKTEELTVLTIPPIPSIAGEAQRIEAYQKHNEAIRNLTVGNGLVVIDICHHFHNDDAEKSVKVEMFEKDMIHWNRAAMEIILLELMD